MRSLPRSKIRLKDRRMYMVTFRVVVRCVAYVTIRMASGENKADGTKKGGNDGSWLIDVISHTGRPLLMYLHRLPKSSLQILCSSE